MTEDGRIVLYRGRARVEQLVGNLKGSKRVAPRCQNTASSLAAFVALALAFILTRSVYRV
jgi:hypothetical protein